MPTLITAGDASAGVVVTSGSDNALTLQTGPAGGKVNALALDASGNGALLGTMTQGGIATPRMVLAAAQNTTSGTSIDFTGIPSWVKRVTVVLNGVSTNGTSTNQIQIGSGSFTTSGYASSAATNGTSLGSFLTGFPTSVNATAAELRSGIITIALVGSNTWVASGTGGPAGFCAAITGTVTLGGTLDRIRLTTVGGTDTFDAGSVNILYEGY